MPVCVLAELPIVLAELASTRKLLDQMGRDAAERLALGKDDSTSSRRSPKSVKGTPKSLASPTAARGIGMK